MSSANDIAKKQIQKKLTDNANQSFVHGHRCDLVMECIQSICDCRQYTRRRGPVWSPVLCTMHAMVAPGNCANRPF